VREQRDGSSVRSALVLGSLLVGLVIAVETLPLAHAWAQWAAAGRFDR